MKSSKKVLVLLIATAFAGLLTACGAKENLNKTRPVNSTEEQNETFGGDLNGKDGGRIFERTNINIPDAGVNINDAVKLPNNKLFLHGYDSEQNSHYYYLDIKAMEISEDVEITGFPVKGLIDIDGDAKGRIAVLSLNETGEYKVTLFTQGAGCSNLVLTELTQAAGNMYIWNICICEGGYLFSNGQKVFAVNWNGELTSTYEYFNMGVFLCRDGEGNGLIISSGKNEPGTKIQELGHLLSVSKVYYLKNSYDEFFCGADSDIFGIASNTIYRINYKDDTRVGFVNTFASGGGNSRFIYLDDNTFFALYGGIPTIWTPSGSTDLVVLRLATYGESSNLKSAVYMFNESNTQYKIDIVDYAVFDEAGGKDSGMTRLNADIISGNTPDIYDLQVLPSRLYASRGLLQDIKPFFETDPNISYDDLVENVVNTFENKGKLYDLIPAFRVYTLCGNGLTVGDKQAWDNNEFLMLTKNCSPEELFGEEMTRYEFLQYILMFNEGEYFDTTSGKCSFAGSDFVELLKYSALLPETIQSDSQNWGKAYANELKLMMCEIDEFMLLDLLISDVVFHGEANYIGFPSDAGTGVAILPALHLGMSESSDNQDGVWEFFKFLLSDQYQLQMLQVGEHIREGRWVMPGIPGVQNNLEKRLNYWLDIYSEKPAKQLTFLDGEPLFLEGANATNETGQKLIQIISRSACIAELDEDLYRIVVEAAEAYYAGDKTAEEAVSLIQSRAYLYLSEQYG